MNNPLIKIGLGVVILGGLLWYWLASDGNSDIVATLPERESSLSGVKIIAFGDSLTAGYGLPENESYPAQLETALIAKGYQVDVINSGVSGETTRGNLERAPFIRKQNPDIVLLGIGGNDALRLLPLEETKKNMSATIEVLKDGDNPPLVILLKMQAPLNAGLGYKRDFDALYEELAGEYGLILVPFLTTELFLNSDNKLNDGIHYNATGYGKVVEQYLLPELIEVLDQLNGD